MGPGEHIDLTELLRVVLDARAADVWTSIVGKVTAAPEAGYVDVQPMVRRPVESASTGDTVHEDLPTIPRVRILYFCTASIRITFPVPVGSVGLLLVSTLDARDALESGEVTSPDDQRFHHLGSALFLPCLTLASDLPAALASAPNALVLEAADIQLGAAGATRKLACADSVASAFADVANALTHLTSPSGAVTGSTFTVPPTADDLGSSKVKVDS